MCVFSCVCVHANGYEFCVFVHDKGGERECVSVWVRVPVRECASVTSQNTTTKFYSPKQPRQTWQVTLN